MLLKIKRLYLIAGRPIAILHEDTAKWLNLHVGERIRLCKYGQDARCLFAPIDITGGNTILNTDEIALSQEIVKELNLGKREVVDVSPGLRPLSVEYIKKKLNGNPLTYTEIYSIISDIVKNNLTEIEIAYFVSGVYEHDLNFKETIDLTKSILKTGNILKIDRKMIIDKHSIGGVEGNRTTPILVSIIGAAIDKFRLNAAIPKTSSRAVTSAAGTADVVETITGVEFSFDQLKEIVEKTNACMVWGGSLGLAPADDKLIQVERILSLDPRSQLLASIMSKKLAVGATHLLIDISYGRGSKMPSIRHAKKLKKKFEKMARVLGIKLIVTLTKGDEPVGSGIGPSLEMRDIISVLRQDKNRSLMLENRAIYLTTRLLSLILEIPTKRAEKIAREMLISKIAWNKFLDIVKAQGGDPEKFDERLVLGRFKTNIFTKKSGKIEEISNKKLSRIARLAGSPADHGTGIYLYKHLHENVNKKEALFTIYSETKEKLAYAKKIAETIEPFVIK